MPIVSEKPLIEILSPEEQHDRFDINYYLPEFIDAEKSLESSSTPLTTFGEIMENDASYGVLPPSSCYLEDEGGILLIRSSNINNEGIDYEDAIRVPSEWLDSERARIKQNDILISIKGARAFFDMCVAPEESPEAIVNGSIFRFQCKEHVSPKFVVLWLLSKSIQSLVFRERTNLGISYISLEILKSIPFPDIPHDEQIKIIGRYQSVLPMLSPQDSIISEFNKKLSAITKRYNSLLSSECGVHPPKKSGKVIVVKPHIFSDRLDWKCYDPSYISSQEELSSTYGEWTTISEISHLKNDYSKGEDPNEECKILKIRLHGKGAALRDIVERRKISGPLTSVKEGQLVFSRIRCAQKGIAIVPHDLDGAFISKEYYAIEVDPNKYITQLLFRILISDRYVAFYKSVMTGGTTRYRLAVDDFLGLRLPKVTVEMQEKVLAALIEIENEADAVRSEKEAYIQNCRKNEQRVLSNLLHLSEDKKFQSIQKRISEALQ